ncbi:cytochrome b/b6 domain-containing protein [Sporichthya sp.]|uniref:cytochrome b/b6 domain-containing protein n=1 Tax=Sporichthya sp. TaxID=65475 RepID=UPI00179B0366|nr:cytochrome b/b6 domain-containing protein [Sporichthya sp.]MBA3742207.1 cytochrome b/b6 domain-containing protein [Sporichthya sp.]
MTRPAEGVLRFGPTSRWVHATAGTLTLACILTAAVLYNGSLSNLIGNRHTVRAVHVWCGFALPVPLLLGLASAAHRRDLHLLNRFDPHDWRWLRSRNRRDGRIPVGKFNAGQKVNAALSAGALAVLLLTGSVMYFTQWTPLAWRSGATFTHDWFALGLGLLVCGHTLYAVRSPVALRAMRTGSVPLAWARSEHGAWAEEVAGPSEKAVSAGE